MALAHVCVGHCYYLWPYVAHVRVGQCHYLWPQRMCAWVSVVTYGPSTLVCASLALRMAQSHLCVGHCHYLWPHHTCVWVNVISYGPITFVCGSLTFPMTPAHLCVGHCHYLWPKSYLCHYCCHLVAANGVLFHAFAWPCDQIEPVTTITTQ